MSHAQTQRAPYGSWKSPITPELVVSDAIRLGLTILDGEDTYWIEGRPAEGGRNVIVRRGVDGSVSDMTPHPFNARTRVHEYGGGDFIVNAGTIYFTNFGDQRLYRQIAGGMPEPMTPEVNKRYADPVVDHQYHRLICVCEDHSDTEREAVNTLVSVPLDGSGTVQTLVAGNDFYSSPCLSPDGTHLAWLTWNHPNMPWDGCELWAAGFAADGAIADAERIAGGPFEALFQPQWSPDGILHFISDRSGWWNLYRLRDGYIEALCNKQAEFGVPQWVFNSSTYGFAEARRIICWYEEKGEQLASLNTDTGELTTIEAPYTTMGGLRVTPERVVLKGASATEPVVIAQLDLGNGTFEVLRRSSSVSVDAAYVSIPQEIEFPTEGGLTAYAYYYAPRNPDYSAPEGELPPLLVESHGGPTAATSTVFSLQTQFWTSRGFAVLDVNYGGSSGYGREYRERLRGQWGVVDVDDCVNGAKYLVQRGLADSNRLAIRGGSAGGYTTLSALAFRDTFKAGASHFGVSDLTIFVHDTHKFESRYLFSLVGPYPERKDLYYERSPINYTDDLSCPIIFFQGLEDKIVPPNQAEKMVEALRAKNVPVAYLPFEGEQHGFRRAENIKRALEAELYFYSKVFAFEMPDSVEPVTIENL
jgi:dipeptidyl aminopeptidase/acylaminoacyl peptidase